MDNRNLMINYKEINKTIEALLTQRGFQIFDENLISDVDPDIRQIAFRNPKYMSIYGKESKNNFLLIDYDKHIRKRVEIKIQSTSGSVDQKFPYLYLNAALTFPKDDDVILLLEGKGYSHQSINWLKSVSSEGWLIETGKRIDVMSLSEFIDYLDGYYK